MSLSHKKQNKNLSNPAVAVRKANFRNTPFEWSKIVSGTARNTQSFTPTFANPTVPTEASNVTDQSIMSESRQSVSIELVRPFLKGIEKNSVLIDVTKVHSPQMLREALQAFNKDAVENNGYEDYCGRLPQIRKYLNRSFIETMWLNDSPGHKAILETGITLPDNTFVKDFPSFPADSRIVRLKLEKLPFKPLRLLKQDMEDRLSSFGEVLDLGVTKSNGCFMGQGYATLDLTRSIDENTPPYEQLQRVILWREDDGDERQVLLQWEDMPDFCRLCQLTGHCRADCPDYQKFLKCHNCNLTGHVMRNCPHNNAIDSVTAINKKRLIAPAKERKIPVSVELPVPPPVVSVRDEDRIPEENKEQSVEKVEKIPNEPEDAVMIEVIGASPSSSDGISSNDAHSTKGKQVNQLRSPRHGPVESDLNEIAKLDRDSDISDGRHSNAQNTTGSNNINSLNSAQTTSNSVTGSPGEAQ